MLYRPTRSVTDYALLQHDIDSIAWWTDQNFLDFNANKCKYMIISRKLHSNNSHNPLTALMINCTELEQVDSFKYLGVWITSTLSWSKHVTEVCRKARQKVGIFHRKCYQYDNTATMLSLVSDLTSNMLSKSGLHTKKVIVTHLKPFKSLHFVFVQRNGIWIITLSFVN